MSRLVVYQPSKPSRWQRLRQQIRSYVVNGLSLKDPNLAKFFDTGYSPTYADIPVTPETAFTFSAVYDAVNQISSDVAKLPLNLHKRRSDGGSDLYSDSKLYRLVKYEPNPEMGSMVFRRTLLAHALTSHGGYAEIERGGDNKPVALWPITPDRVEPIRKNGALAFRIDGNDDRIIRPENMIHLRGLGYDGVTAYPLVQKARQAIALGLAAERFGSTFFGSGASFGGILISEQEMPAPGSEEETALRNSLNKYQTEAGRTQRFLTLFGQGWKYEKTGINPSDAQMDDLRDKQVEEVARFFNMPLHKLKNLKRATNNNIEHQDLEYYKGCLLNWITLWEEELNRKLISPLEARQQYFKHNVNAFLRGDTKSRSEFYNSMLQNGVFNADMVLELEDLNPQPDGQGKVFLVNSAMVPKDKLSDKIDADIAKLRKDAQPDPQSPDADAVRVAQERAERAEQLLADAEQRVQDTREKLAAVEATGTATAEELARLTDAFREAQQQATNLTVLASDLRERYDLVLAAKETSEAERRLESEARARAEVEAQKAHERAEAAEHARQDAERAAEELRAQEAVARADVEAAQQLAAEAEARAQQAGADKDAEAAARAEAERLVKEAQDALVSIAAERDAAEQKAGAATHEAEELRTEAAAADAKAKSLEIALEQEADARATAEKAIGELTDTLNAAHESEQQAIAAREAIESERHAVAAQREDAEQALVSLRQQIADTEAALEQAQASHQSDVQGLKESLEQAQESERAAMETIDALESRAAESEQALKAQRRAELDRLSNTLTAHRALIVDAMGRMVRREVEKAKRHQATPQKLRTWINTVDTLHADVCVEALLPAMRVHLAWKGEDTDPTAATEALVQAHLTSLRDKLMAVADVDPSEYHALLGKTLERWEQEQPERIADQVLKESIAYLRAAESQEQQ